MSDSLRTNGPQHAILPYPSLSPRVCPSSCPLNQWCFPTISSSAAFLSWSFPASGSFSVSQLFTSGGQSIRASASASASVLPMNMKDWFPLGLTGLISLQSKGCISSTTIWNWSFKQTRLTTFQGYLQIGQRIGVRKSPIHWSIADGKGNSIICYSCVQYCRHQPHVVI